MLFCIFYVITFTSKSFINRNDVSEYVNRKGPLQRDWSTVKMYESTKFPCFLKDFTFWVLKIGIRKSFLLFYYILFLLFYYISYSKIILFSEDAKSGTECILTFL